MEYKKKKITPMIIAGIVLIVLLAITKMFFSNRHQKNDSKKRKSRWTFEGKKIRKKIKNITKSITGIINVKKAKREVPTADEDRNFFQQSEDIQDDIQNVTEHIIDMVSHLSQDTEKILKFATEAEYGYEKDISTEQVFHNVLETVGKEMRSIANKKRKEDDAVETTGEWVN